MNRAERRKLAKRGCKVPFEPIVNMKPSDIKNIKDKASKDAVDIAFTLMLAIPVTIVHQHYGQLMKKEVDGKSRCERFADLCIDLYKSFEKGEVTLDDLKKHLQDEAGIKIERG